MELLHVPQPITQEMNVLHTNSLVDSSSVVEETVAQERVEDVSLLERCPHFRGWYVRPEDVSLLERCPHFRGWYVRPEDVSLLERCPHFRGWYVRPEDVSLLERCPHFRGWYVRPEDVSLLERCPHFRGWYILVLLHLLSGHLGDSNAHTVFLAFCHYSLGFIKEFFL